MHSLFPLLGIFVLILDSLLVTVTANDPKSLIGNGYNCNNEHIPVDRILAAVDEAKECGDLAELYRNTYRGPPFTKDYLLWPLSLSPTPRKGDSTSYRVVLDDDFNVFSVVTKVGSKVVIECQLQEKLRLYPSPTMITSDDRIAYSAIVEAKIEACSKIRKELHQKFPARYDGKYFTQYGLQRYMFPVLLDGSLWQEGQNPGNYRMIMNSECDLLGVSSYRHQQETAHVTFVHGG